MIAAAPCKKCGDTGLANDGCPDCGGYGLVHGCEGDPEDCSRCGGSGWQWPPVCKCGAYRAVRREYA